MSDTNGTNSAGDQPEPSIEEIESNIAQTRQDLAATVDALSAKTDVKARARQQVQATTARARNQVHVTTARGKDALTDERGDLRPVVPIAAGVALVVAIGVVVLVRRRR